MDLHHDKRHANRTNGRSAPKSNLSPHDKILAASSFPLDDVSHEMVDHSMILSRFFCAYPVRLTQGFGEDTTR
jgi:hypothetical protein